MIDGGIRTKVVLFCKFWEGGISNQVGCIENYIKHSTYNNRTTNKYMALQQTYHKTYTGFAIPIMLLFIVNLNSSMNHIQTYFT